MREFFVGLLVLALMAILSVAGVLLIPFLLVLGIFFRVVLGFFLILFAVWLVGKITLLLIEWMSKKNG